MRTLDDLAPTHAAALAELTARLKHDLGKYVSFGARWLPADADLLARREALADDLLRTRRGPDGEQDAPTVWEAYRPRLLGERGLRATDPAGERVDLADDTDVRRIVRAMQALTSLVERLRAGQSLSEDEVDAGLATCREVSTACRELHRRAQEASRDHG